jgi:hypothetical protein
MTTTAKKTISIDSIEALNKDSIMFVCDNEYSAKAALKRNPYAQVQHGDDGRIALIYAMAQTNLLNAIKRA